MCGDEKVLTLTCAKRSGVSLWILKRIIECGIVMTVIRIVALNADMMSIFLRRGNLRFLQRCKGAATRKVSAMTSAAKFQNLRIITHRKYEGVLTN